MIPQEAGAELWGLDAVAWSALAAWATWLVAVVVGIAAFRQVREARRTREAQAQPYVVVDFEPSEASTTLMDIVVRNTGSTVARDIRFSFDPPLRSAMFEKDETSGHPARLRMFLEGIPTLPPGKSYRALFDTMPERYQSDLPRQHLASVEFSGPAGPCEPLTYVLDLDLYFGITHVTVRGLHDAANALRDIRDTLKKWTAHLNGVRVYSLDEDARRTGSGRSISDRTRASANPPDGAA